MIIKLKLVLLFFISQVLLNWLFIAWVQNQPDIRLSAWVVLLPVLGYLYFSFALIASIAIFYKKKTGVMLGYVVLMVGATSSVISYNCLPDNTKLTEFILIFLIIINFLVMTYMAFNQAYFESE